VLGQTNHDVHKGGLQQLLLPPCSPCPAPAGLLRKAWECNGQVLNPFLLVQVMFLGCLGVKLACSPTQWQRLPLWLVRSCFYKRDWHECHMALGGSWFP